MIRKFQNIDNWAVFYILVGITVVSLLFSVLSHSMAGGANWWSWADSAFQNFSTEMMGAIATFALFELIVNTRNNKKNLIIQMRSQDNSSALNAVSQLDAKGWLKDGSLEGADFRFANLEGAKLRRVNLQDTRLRRINLQGADLREANLQDARLKSGNLQSADLGSTNLQGANLNYANLQNAKLWRAKLQDTDLLEANLQSADLWYANLQDANLLGVNLQSTKLLGVNLEGAKLESTKFDKNTILPDAKEQTDEHDNIFYDKYWTPDTDMSHYTNPEHPDFWQPDWVKGQND